MTDDQAGVTYTIEPLDPSKHDRATFSCGVAQVDNYFRNTANKLAKAGNVRVHVMTDQQGDLIGFYALNAHSIHYEELPEKLARNRPGHGQISAAYISMIGVSERRQGQGFGGDLLVDGLRRIARAAGELGIRVVLMDVLDCGKPENVERRLKLYRSYGFESFPSNPLRMFIPMTGVRAIIADEGTSPPQVPNFDRE